MNMMKETVEANAPAAGAANIPDSRGINFFTSDPDCAALLRLHLGEARFRGFEPELRALGLRASDELDRLASRADRNPPLLPPRPPRGAPIRHGVHLPHDSSAQKCIAYSASSARFDVSSCSTMPPCPTTAPTAAYAS